MSRRLLYLKSLICSFFFFKQKTAYEMRISDWSSDVCSSDLLTPARWEAAIQTMRGHIRISVLHGLPQAIQKQVMGTRMTDDEYVYDEDSGEWIPASELERKKIGRASCRERVCQYV